MKRTLLFSKKIYFTFLLLFICFFGFSQSQTFNNPADNGTTANTFTIPAGVNSITIEAWGAGGRGGSAIQNGVSNAGGGGGGGAYSKKTIPVTSGATYNLIVGSGGNGVTLNGGNSSFNTNITVARGGIGVTTNNLSGGNGGNWVTGDGDSGYSGGNGGSGIAASYGGGGGSSAGTASIGTNGSNSNGGIITIGGGNGGNGSTTNGNNPGLQGDVPGGGGGGATKGTGNAQPVGGNGGNGQVIISWTACTPPTTANAGTDQTLAACATTTTLSGNNPTVGAGSWSVVSGIATITNPSSRTTAITGLVLGTSATLRWTIANAPCPDSIDDVVITTVTGATCLSYCSPTYTNGPGTVDQITNVTLGTLNNTTGPSASPYYIFYNSLTKPNLLQSSTASISISFGPDANQYAAVWIDFNQDGTFQSGEGAISGNAGANGTIVINIPVPAGAVLGNTRMRVRGGDDFALTTSQACNASNSIYGETEDYIINIIASAPPTIASLGATNGCVGGSITINGTNLTGATAANVRIGGTPVSSITSNSGTQIVAVIGAGTTGTVSITTAGGTATSTATFTVNPIPTITGTTPGSRTGIGTVNLSATASAGTISWYANLTGGSALGTGNNFTTPVLLSTTTYYVEATNVNCTSSPRVAVVATIDVAEISVSSNGFNIADDDTTPIETDNTNLGTVNLTLSTTKTYTIQNSGTINLELGTIVISGLNASEFVVTSTPSLIVAPGGSTTFNITFTPLVTGNRTASVSFTTNDADENPFNFDIAGTGGTGVTPEINLSGLGANIMDGASGALATNGTAFGSTAVGSTISRTFTIQNIGTGPLELTGNPLVFISGSASFTVSTQPNISTIPAGGSVTFVVSFTPTTTGSFVAIINISNTDTDESLYDFVITGSAIVTGREIDIQGNEVSIVAGDTTPSTTDQTDFGITDTTTSIRLPFNVYSFGTDNLTITSVSISGTNATQFVVTPLNITLASGAVTTFVVTFTPTTVLGVKNATVTVLSNDPDEGTYTFVIRAEVQNLPALTIAPGGITSNLKFWLKADSNIGAVSNNTILSDWTDQTHGSTKNATSRFSKEPRFQDNTSFNVNFNPVIQFNGNNWMSGGQGFNNTDMFIVVKPTVTFSSLTSPQDIYSGDDVTQNQGSQDVTGFQMGNTSARHVNELLAYNQAANTAFGVAEISTTKTYGGVNIFNPRRSSSFPTIPMDILNNGSTLTTNSVNAGTYLDIVNTRYWLGRSEFFDASYNGAILEVINYNVRNSDTDKRKIETYLAIKYGITLGTNGMSLDYIDSAGTNIYEVGSGYNYNITGIGRDDRSRLIQKQSKSENTISDITVGLGNIFATNSTNTNTFMNDRDFLVWGHNNNTLAAQSPVIVNMSSGISPSLTSIVDFVAIGRTWRVKETGTVGSVKVSIPSVMLTATITPPGDFLMFVSDSPVFSPTAEYRIMIANGSNLETTYDFNGIKYITFGYAPERTYPRSVDFDGTNDYMDAGNVLNLNTNFTVAAWVKKSTNNRTIISKRNAAFTEGYDLSINSTGRAEMRWFNGSMRTITSSVTIPSEKWHHVAVIYNGTNATMYIDGVVDTNVALPNVLATNRSFLIAAADGAAPTSFFDGNIDEVRVWNVALTVNQLRYSMNQEILKNGTLTNGFIIPNTITLNEISAVPWSNLSAYYPMSTYTYTNAKDISDNNFTAAIKNLNTVDLQTAPLPYDSDANGNWETASTWRNNAVQDIPNSLSLVNSSIIVDWNIVRTNHNIVSRGNKTLLGLFVNSNTLTATSASGLQTDGTKIEVSHYLKLDGKIDLVGRSQLVQKSGSHLDPDSSGSLERDQQGQSNKFNYNYWSSPVGAINNTTNNNNFTVDGVLRDGTNTALTTPPLINWINGFDGATSPLSLARYWIYKFDNLANNYANWTQIFETGILQAGKGFTLKGPGGSGTQNLTFLGKPNNGTITNTVGADQLLLVGNPYPSALDANKFIDDNIGSIETSITNAAIDGALYFWEHYATNTSHNLGAYQGGYGVYNKSGGVKPSATGVDFISGTGSSSKQDPKRYIPVGQGFFVIGKIGSGGTVIFNNSQREFIKEDNTSFSQTTYRIPKTPKDSNHWTDNSNARIENDTHKRVRLGFNLYNQSFHRQVLLAFMDEKANSEMNDGYDAYNIDDSPSDMYLLNGDNELAIQGEGYFDEEASYPIGVRSDSIGKISFVLDGLENFDESQNIFIHDNETDTYHSIKDKGYEVEMPEGTFNDRFSLRFIDKSLATKDPLYDNAITVFFTRSNNVLNIKNSASDNTVLSASLYNIQGKLISKWDVEEKEQSNIKIPIQDKTSAVYLVKLKTAKGNISKKIIIK